jgi:dTDP-4-dehydrorhamnose 3,5-epimerase
MPRVFIYAKQLFDFMIFTETKLKGAFIIQPEKMKDDRGFFARTFCQREFKMHGLNTDVVQCSVSYNNKKGTFRGMHFQVSPFEEDKVVSCVQGALLDYIVDMRESSPTFRQWIAVELSADNAYSLYIPKSFAHGFFTLKDHTLVHYQMSEFYQPDHAKGFRYDDPAFDITLPFAITTMAERDRTFSDLFVAAD